MKPSGAPADRPFEDQAKTRANIRSSAMAHALLAPLILLAACQQGDQPVPTDARTAQVPSAPQEIDSVDRAAMFEEKTDAYVFSYGWPAAVGEIPPLRGRLTAERNERLENLKQEAAEGQREAKRQGFEAPPHAFSKDWKVVTDLPRFLSLSADIYTYTGGAHGMSLSDALVWDREAREAIAPIDMFVAEASLDRAAQTRWTGNARRNAVRRSNAATTASAIASHRPRTARSSWGLLRGRSSTGSDFSSRPIMQDPMPRAAMR